MIKPKLKARSPAKLILSGEHAVVHGHPAIALAVDRYVESCVSSHLLPTIFFNFLNLDYAKSFTVQALTLLKHRLHEQYYAFLQGQCNIREVLMMPFELLQFAVSNLLENLNIALPHGLEIHTSSNIPMGCGMGSSAASVMSVLFALAHYLKLDIDPNRFLSLGKEAENLQHGRSSGLDLHLALQGGCIKFKQGQVENKPALIRPFTIVHTGKPFTTTGQCVSEVAPHFQKTTIGDDFATVTRALECALFEGKTDPNNSELRHCIRENHQLLNAIGVVPEKVATFIKAIEARGYAAKICGAGSTQGDNAGVVWMIPDQDNQNMDDLLLKYGYQMHTVLGDNSGTHLV